MKQSISFKSIALAALLALQFATPARAQVTEFGLFDHLSVGLTLGTTGTGVDVAAPIGNFLQVRAGYNFFSGFTYSEKIDYRAKGKKERGKTEAKAKNYMSTAHLLLDAYPFPKIHSGIRQGGLWSRCHQGQQVQALSGYRLWSCRSTQAYRRQR